MKDSDMASTKLLAGLCLLMCIFVHDSVALHRTYNGNTYAEPFNTISCANCTIQWDSIGHEYLGCVGLDSCPNEYDQRILDTHSDSATFYNHTWISIRRNVTDGSFFIIFPEADIDRDYSVGSGTGATEIAGCFKCMAVYIDIDGAKSTYNYCMDDDCSKYSKYLGSFSWDPVRDIVSSQHMVCTNFEIPGEDPIVTHGHCFHDWSIAPLDVVPAGLAPVSTTLSALLLMTSLFGALVSGLM